MSPDAVSPPIDATTACDLIHWLLRGLALRRLPPSESPLPFRNGIYIFYEVGEEGHQSADPVDGRIVRIGTHGAPGRLPGRLDQHYGGNTDASVFRRHIGDALTDQGRPASEDDITTRLYSGFAHRVISVELADVRAHLEARLIAAVAQCRDCSSSSAWLGLRSPNDAIRASGLWNVQHTSGPTVDQQDLVSLIQAVNDTHRRGPDPFPFGPRRRPPPPSPVREPRRPLPWTGAGGAALDLPRHLSSLRGEDPIYTLDRRRPNWITDIDRDSVWVETERSRALGSGPQPVPLAWIQEAFETLMQRGRLDRDLLGEKASKRSAFILAVLARLPGVTHTTRPILLELRPEAGRDDDANAPKTEW